MKKFYFLIVIPLIVISCKKDNSSLKFYDFKINNELTTSTIKLVPLTKTDFWLLSADTILVIPGEKIIIGTLSEYNDDKKIVDRYEDGDKIESFDLYIDNVKSNIDFSTRKYWTFETGLVDQSAIYILNINEDKINLD